MAAAAPITAAVTDTSPAAVKPAKAITVGATTQKMSAKARLRERGWFIDPN